VHTTWDDIGIEMVEEYDATTDQLLLRKVGACIGHVCNAAARASSCLHLDVNASVEFNHPAPAYVRKTASQGSSRRLTREQVGN
jgi:hypothetical protein